MNSSVEPGVVLRTRVLNVSLVRPSGGGYAPLGLCFSSEGGGSETGGGPVPCDYRMLLWGRPGDGRVGLFVPAGVTGRLPERVVLSDSSERRLGSGVFVPGLRGVRLRIEAVPPENRDGEIWLRVTATPGSAWREIPARAVA